MAQVPLGVSGYPRGSPQDRARAALGPPQVPFPGIPDLVVEQRWRLITPAGPEPSPTVLRNSQDGPPIELPQEIIDSAAQVSWNQAAGLDLLESAFQTGFFARLHCRTYTLYRGPRLLSEPSFHFIVLRAPGVGSAVRLRRASDFDFVAPVSSVESVAVGFRALREAEAFCLGAAVALPPLFERC